MKGTAITFLMTDNQIVNEKFLVYINDLLSTGYIADLCTQEDKDTFCNSVRGEVKQAGMVDSSDNCWDFFIDKVNSFLTPDYALVSWHHHQPLAVFHCRQSCCIDWFIHGAILHSTEVWTHIHADSIVA